MHSSRGLEFLNLLVLWGIEHSVAEDRSTRTAVRSLPVHDDVQQSNHELRADASQEGPSLWSVPVSRLQNHWK